jgi:2,4-dichlorophenol 6-monooxygenase
MPAGPLDNTPASPGYDTDVLVAGSGPAGGSMALLLATYGVRVQMITKYGQLADTPRAHITNQRTVEVFRDMGIEHLLQREATPWELMSNTTYCTSLAGQELGRVPSWGTDPRRHADYLLASPCTMVDAPQTIVEPILVSQAQVHGLASSAGPAHRGGAHRAFRLCRRGRRRAQQSRRGPRPAVRGPGPGRRSP